MALLAHVAHGEEHQGDRVPRGELVVAVLRSAAARGTPQPQR